MVSSLLKGSAAEAMWQESEGFSLERERLERRYHFLQSQRERLENCLKLVSISETSSSLRDAVDDAAAAAVTVLSDALSPTYFNSMWQTAAQQKRSYVEAKQMAGLLRI